MRKKKNKTASQKLYYSFRKQFGNELRKLRAEQGWTKRETAEKLNCGCKNFITHVEHGGQKDIRKFFLLLSRYNKSFRIEIV